MFSPYTRSSPDAAADNRAIFPERLSRKRIFLLTMNQVNNRDVLFAVEARATRWGDDEASAVTAPPFCVANRGTETTDYPRLPDFAMPHVILIMTKFRC